MNKPSTYWRDKLSVWLHDPVIKALDIKGHEESARKIAETLFQTVPDKQSYSTADSIAAGLSRAALPGYSENSNENGAVDFVQSPILVHPLSKSSLPFELPKVDVSKLAEDVIALLKKDLGLDKDFQTMQSMAQEDKPLNALFDRKTSPEEWAEGLFNYLFFAFPKRLRNQNVGGLGAVWDLLPADTRMPDHSIWNHLGLASAVSSAMELDKQNKISLIVFSITPVQEFIAKSRKLRDYWTASVLLSYLAFTGIKTVMKELGADHVVYPSLHNQSLVELWLGKEFNLTKYLSEPENSELKKLQDESANIAAFPNKFVFLAPQSAVQEVCGKIKDAVQTEWIRVAGFVGDYLRPKSEDASAFDALWKRQVEEFWNCSWAASRLLELGDIDTVKKLLAENKYKDECFAVRAFACNYNTATARLYATTHSLVQGVLAAGKSKATKIKSPQHGEKCPLCGENEVLHNFNSAGITKATEYSAAIKAFWDKIRERTNGEEGYAQTGKNERLDAICAIKRFLPVAIKRHKGEILFHALKIEENFPSTTEMAAHDYLRSLTGKIAITQNEYPKLVQALHSADTEESYDDEHSAAIRELIHEGKTKNVTFTERDKYYAFLLMDGDKMGDLINGETLSATWKDVLHPDLAKRFENSAFANKSPLRKKDESGNTLIDKKRTINPAVHAAISDALNSFARFCVQPAVSKAGGRLVYAGGDDVCAILPLDAAITVCKEISEGYTLNFAQYTKDGAEKINRGICDAEKIGFHLGSASEGISISGAIIIAHHKTPLKEVIKDAHFVLDSLAKEKSGRNSLAIRLKKRSGGDRDFYCKWNDKNQFAQNDRNVLDSFLNVKTAVGKDKLSASFLYKIENLKPLFLPLLGNLNSNREKILSLFEYELNHSGKGGSKISKDEMKMLAEDIAGICIAEKAGRADMRGEAVIIANFLGSGARENGGEK